VALSIPSRAPHREVEGQDNPSASQEASSETDTAASTEDDAPSGLALSRVSFGVSPLEQLLRQPVFGAPPGEVDPGSIALTPFADGGKLVPYRPASLPPPGQDPMADVAMKLNISTWDWSALYPIPNGPQQAFEGLTNTQLLDRILPSGGGPDLNYARSMARSRGSDPVAAQEQFDGYVLAMIRDPQINGSAPDPNQPVFDRLFDQNIFGATNGPLIADLQQGNTGDCFLLSTLGALALQQPDVIKNAIAYDAATQSFNVTLYLPTDSSLLEPKRFLGNAVVVPVVINVTQADLRENVLARQGSVIDNNFTAANGYDKGGASWSAILETAFVKSRDSNPRDGLLEGYADANGGYTRDAFRILTGGTSQDFQLQPHAGTRGADLEAVYEDLSRGLSQHQPMTYSLSALTFEDRQAAFTQFGLESPHAFTVTKIFKDVNGEAWAELRNPNGPRKDEMGNVTSDVIYARLGDLYDLGAKGVSTFSVHEVPPTTYEVGADELSQIELSAPQILWLMQVDASAGV
jgi:hypothetical protein